MDVCCIPKVSPNDIVGTEWKLYLDKPAAAAAETLDNNATAAAILEHHHHLGTVCCNASSSLSSVWSPWIGNSLDHNNEGVEAGYTRCHSKHNGMLIISTTTISNNNCMHTEVATSVATVTI
ncbi:hypothetical protein ACA910_001601 [Epithemia clementina (nom. ined.)]